MYYTLVRDFFLHVRGLVWAVCAFFFVSSLARLVCARVRFAALRAPTLNFGVVCVS